MRAEAGPARGERWAVPLLSRLPSNRTMVIHRGLRGQDKQGVSGTKRQPKIVSAQETCYANHSTRAWVKGVEYHLPPPDKNQWLEPKSWF